MECEGTCPRCGAARMRRWDELTADEREVARRVSAPDDETENRRKRSLWCARCWHEEIDLRARMA